MDPHALRVIEFPKILALLAERCETEQAASAALQLSPSIERRVVEWRQRETAEARQAVDRENPPALGTLRDVRQHVDGAARGMTLPGEVLFQVYETLLAGRRLREFVLGRESGKSEVRNRKSGPDTRYPIPETPHPSILSSHAAQIASLPQLEKRLFDTVLPEGEVKDSASPELGRLRSRMTTLGSRISDRMHSLCNKFRDSLSDAVVTQRDGRWCLPVKTDFKGKVRGIVHDTSASGMTVFVEPEEVLALGNQLRESEAAERHEVERILKEVSSVVGTHTAEILASLDACAALDLAFAKGRLASDMDAVEPRLADQPEIMLRRARHPLLDRDTVVPVDIDVGHSFLCLLITGPNTGGKTVAVKLAGLAAAMAQSGLQVPATDAALGVFPQLWADIGDEQSLQQSLSTFSSHLRNIQRMLVGVQPGALVLLDEIGAGTDPAEGAALAKAILTRLLQTQARVICTTHYGELKAFAYNTEGIQNAAVEFDVETLRPTYRIKIGVPGASHALTIAERYGIPHDVLDEARSGLSAEHQDVSRMLDKLDLAQRDAENARHEADKLAASLKKERKELAERLAQAEEVRRKAKEGVREQIDEVRHEIRAEAEAIFERLRAMEKQGKGSQEARSDLKVLDELARDFAEEVTPEPVRAPQTREPRKGDAVRISSYSQTGRLLTDPADGKAQVQVGPLKLTVETRDLEVIEEPATKSRRPTPGLGLSRSLDISPELHIRMMRAEPAMEEVEKYLDDALLAGLDRVRIVHGKGTGVLRKAVHDLLRKHAGVAGYRLADAPEGGDGATIVDLKR